MNNYENQVNYIKKRIEIQAEINANPVRIDKSIFNKSPLEKLKIKNAKLTWQREMKKKYKDFIPNKWGSSGYRLAHPQEILK